MADALKNVARIFPLLPDQHRPDTVPAIFGRTYDENFLSSYLAYAIDPSRNGIGSEPLRCLLRLAHADPESAVLENVTITREFDLGQYGRIDLLIQFGNGVVLGLENKVLAPEGGGQTTSYVEGFAHLYPDYEKYFLYLTRQSQKASSRKFVPLSYQQLLDEFSAIRYDWPANLKKSVLWEDFLEHVRAYIAMGEGMMELSEKAKLYIENHQLIQDLTKTFNREAEAFFTYFQNVLAAELSTDEWTMVFYGSRTYQQIYRPSWSMPELWVHYEYFMSPNVLLKDSFVFVLEVEKKNAGKFIESFKLQYDHLKKQYDELGLVFRPNIRPQALAWKSYPLDGNPENIARQLRCAFDEFSFLTPVIDNLIDEFQAQQATTVDHANLGRAEL